VNKKIISDEKKLIFLCTRLKIDSPLKDEIVKLASATLNWIKVLEIALQQNTTPLLYYNLNRLRLTETIPQSTLRALRRYYYDNLQKNLYIEKEVCRLIDLLAKSNITVIPFKGFSIVQTLYGNPALRMMVDVDILIKTSDLPRLKKIMFSDGYKACTEEGTGEKSSCPQHEICFSKQTALWFIIFIELHLEIVPARPYKLILPRLWQRTTATVSNGQKMLHFSPEDTFLVLALHLRRHARRLTLVFILDIAELLNARLNTLDWNYIKENTENNHIRASVYCSLYLAQEILASRIPDQIIDLFRPNFIKGRLIRLALNRHNFLTLEKWQGTFLRILLFDRLTDFLLYLWRVSFRERIVSKIFPRNTIKSDPRESINQ
jgi:hypothetical protein